MTRPYFSKTYQTRYEKGSRKIRYEGGKKRVYYTRAPYYDELRSAYTYKPKSLDRILHPPSYSGYKRPNKFIK